MSSHEPVAKRIASQIEGTELHGACSSAYKLTIVELQPVRPRIGWFHLVVAIRQPNGEPSRSPLMVGLVSGGGRGVMPWFECRLYPSVKVADGGILDSRTTGLEAAFVELLGTLIPPGGHLMIEYETPGQGETHSELLLRIPPVATHLGSLMFRAGFCGEFKDWYISEGGHEGPRKLQANKSPTPKAAREAMRTHLAELESFVKRPLPKRPEDAAIVARARDRARSLLKEIAHLRRPGVSGAEPKSSSRRRSSG
jgi:hypothetical protein